MDRKMTLTLTTVLAITLITAWPALASDTKGGMDHGSGTKEQMSHQMSDQMSGQVEHGGGHAGQLIHEADVDGYHIRYELIDMQARMKGMENMPKMAATHHLMVYITDSAGNPVGGGKVGYLIVNPDGTDQKAMAMGMAGGYGADVDLSAPGNYTVKMKIVAGDTRLMDGFAYTVE